MRIFRKTEALCPDAPFEWFGCRKNLSKLDNGGCYRRIPAVEIAILGRDNPSVVRIGRRYESIGVVEYQASNGQPNLKKTSLPPSELIEARHLTRRSTHLNLRQVVLGTCFSSFRPTGEGGSRPGPEYKHPLRLLI